jgi:ABC-type multidrug transport system fused ATPase/permease subunit
MLRACAATILGSGEKAIMASGGGVRMIMAVSSGRIGAIVMMIVAIVVVIVTLHHRMIVVILFRLLFVMLFRVILGTQGQGDHGSQ